MSRCQHNERISKFCTTPSCSHPTSGGCDFCFKKYHCHIGEAKSVKEAELGEMVKFLTSFENKKTKFRPFKEAIYNYFNILKSQMSTLLDRMSSQLLNQVSYSYIRQAGHLRTFKSIKHRDYNKLSPQEVISILEFNQKGAKQPQALERSEVSEYNRQCQKVHQQITSINKVFQELELQARESLEEFENLTSINIFYKKVDEIFAVIAKADCENQVQLAEEKESRSTNTQKSNTLSFLEKKNQIDQKKQNWKKPEGLNQQSDGFVKSPNTASEQTINRKRKISIEHKCGDLFGKSASKKQRAQEKAQDTKSESNSYEDNEKQIEERKRKLEELMSGSGRKSSKEKSVKGSAMEDSSQSADNEGEHLFDVLAKVGINIPEVIAHTLLPEAHEEKKLYEQRQAVERRTMKIPVNVQAIRQNIEGEDCQSPILRLKKSKQSGTAKGFSLGVHKVSSRSSDSKGSETAELAKQSSSEKSVQSSQEAINIDESEANSLYLLAESLKLSSKKAIPLLQAALKYAPHNFSASEYLSFLYLEEEKPKLCLDVCNRSIALIEAEANAIEISFHLFNNKAAALNLLGRFSESIPILEKCLQVKKKDIIYKNLGDAFFNLGIVEKAVINYESAVILNEQNHQAFYNLAVCYFLQKNYEGCRLKVQRAILIDNKNDHYRQLYKQVEEQLKKK